MRLLILLLAACLLPSVALAQQPAAGGPFVVEQTYWIKPGKELQFLGLFEKQRVPQLRAKVKDGSLLWMRLSKPQFNAANEQWDLRVTLAWRDSDSAIERIASDKSAGSKDSQRASLEQQILDELIVERTEIPIQEWIVGNVGD